MPTETAIEKVLRKNREKFERDKEKPGAEGVFNRLCLVMSPNGVGEWMAGEMTRGTANMFECEQALARVMGYQIIALAMAAPQLPPGEVLGNVLGMAEDFAVDMLRGGSNVPVVSKNMDTGEETTASLGDLLDSKTATKN